MTCPEDRKYLKDQVAEILADRGPDFERFQAMKKKASFKQGARVRFEPIMLDKIYVKDGMKKIRHSRVRMLQDTEDGKTELFVISLDDMSSSRAGGPSPPSDQGSRRSTPQSKLPRVKFGWAGHAAHALDGRPPTPGPAMVAQSRQQGSGPPLRGHRPGCRAAFRSAVTG
jgi:hypothetical protein